MGPIHSPGSGEVPCPRAPIIAPSCPHAADHVSNPQPSPLEHVACWPSGLAIDQVCPSLMEVHQEWALPIGLPLSARQAYRLYRVCGTMKALLRTEGR
jgi:hypothetical protein